MTLLEELTEFLEAFGVVIRTSHLETQDRAPHEYIIMLPTTERFVLFADNVPREEVQDVSLLFFNRGDGTLFRRKVALELLERGYSISDRRFEGFDPQTGYYQFVMDVSHGYEWEEG